MPLSHRYLILPVLLLLAACGHTQPNMAGSADLFTVKPGQSKIFIYASYDSPGNKPYFTHQFQFSLDGYLQTIDDEEFIATNLVPYAYRIHVDEIDWGGNPINSKELNIGLREGKVYFFAAHSVDGKLSLRETPEALGRSEVLARKEKCLCNKPLTQTIGDLF